ncbi:MAG: hypothetical protein A2Z11_00230 [Candidatus Woykebacteria bacterium RBG_16_43_9]|uniref:Uncharacterized protein n=1 Tax=Candidatus Woykebacteria bacterium RBG_16_43_9 TaxID=1802596 RepID=A0A1G1WFR1_9BACT|nr:MAG: hypothetical protein A2Z11_00230 [Candidatus Woykebacteria bacterium RBG_16_43_9]
MSKLASFVFFLLSVVIFLTSLLTGEIAPFVIGLSVISMVTAILFYKENVKMSLILALILFSGFILFVFAWAMAWKGG